MDNSYVQIVLRIYFNWQFDFNVPSWGRSINFSEEPHQIQHIIVDTVRKRFNNLLRDIRVWSSRSKHNQLIMTGVDTGWRWCDQHQSLADSIAERCDAVLINQAPISLWVQMAPGLNARPSVRFKMISCKPFQRGQEPSDTLRNFRMFRNKHVFLSGFEDPVLRTELEIYGTCIDDEITNRTEAIIVEDTREITDDTNHAAINGIVLIGRKKMDFLVLEDFDCRDFGELIFGSLEDRVNI